MSDGHLSAGTYEPMATTPEPADLCVGPYSGAEIDCPDPHCIDRDWDEVENEYSAEALAVRCLPYSPPAEVCGQGAQACAPACCRNGIPDDTIPYDEAASKAVDKLAAEIAAAVEKARETRTVELTDPHATEVVMALMEDMATVEGGSPPDVGGAVRVEDGWSPPVSPPVASYEVTDRAVEAAVVKCREILERGDELMLVPAGTDPNKVLIASQLINATVDPELLALLGWTEKEIADVSKKAETAMEEAARIVSGARRNAYGHPEDNFQRIADLWTAYLKGDKDQRFGLSPHMLPQDVAHLMILMKIARLLESPKHRDSVVDIIGYAACIEALWEREANRTDTMGLI